MFPDALALVDHLLDRQAVIEDAIDRRMLTARLADADRFRARAYVSHVFQTCVYATVPAELRGAIGALAAAHRAAGLEAVARDRFAHELDPVELAARARLIWARTRWPGASGRAAYARAVFAALVLKELEYLSLRLWDGPDPSARLAEVGERLDRLNAALEPDVIVRDARWLIQTAQGALTPDVRPYFVIADEIRRTWPAPARLEMHRAGALLAGGHLRSQLRYRMAEFQTPMDAPLTLAVTRNSNSMDTALLVGDLVPLLEAHRRATAAGERESRLGLADAILQGLSADPDLLLLRLDLLAPFTTLEDLFVESAPPVRSSAMGRTYADLREEYIAAVHERAPDLVEDLATLAPVDLAYSPFGIAYGFCADLIAALLQCRLVAHAPDGVTLEDLFESRSRLEAKQTRTRLLTGLPRLDGERPPFDHAASWTVAVVGRLRRALELRAASQLPNASGARSARLFVRAGVVGATARPPVQEDLPGDAVSGAEYLFSTDPRDPSGATFSPLDELLANRAEGRFLASVAADDHWVALSKNVLSLEIAQGNDVVIEGVPRALGDVLSVTCPSLVRSVQPSSEEFSDER